jgi:hypothetical protein
MSWQGVGLAATAQFIQYQPSGAETLKNSIIVDEKAIFIL